MKINKLLAKFIPLLALMPFVAHGHSHYPSEYKKRITKPYEQVQITLTNMYSKRFCYVFEQDGQITPRRACLKGNETQKFDFLIPVKPDLVTRTEICSIADEKKKIRTRMCTEIALHYPKSLLERALQ